MPTSSESAVAVIQKRTTASGPSLKNMFKSTAVDLQMTVIPGGRGLRTVVRDPRIRGITRHFVFKKGNTISPHAK